MLKEELLYTQFLTKAIVFHSIFNVPSRHLSNKTIWNEKITYCGTGGACCCNSLVD